MQLSSDPRRPLIADRTPSRFGYAGLPDGGPFDAYLYPDDDTAMERKSANMTERVPVPSSEHVAEIVGRQGCKIKALRAKTNTYIKTPVRGEEPVFIITGRKNDVEAARDEILTAADHFSQIRSGKKPVSVTKRSSNNAHLNSCIQNQLSIKVRVPVSVVGLVVGAKGTTIKRIQENTNTYIITPSREREPVFEVIGTSENVEKAKAEIENYVHSRMAACDYVNLNLLGEQRPDLCQLKNDFGATNRMYALRNGFNNSKKYLTVNNTLLNSPLEDSRPLSASTSRLMDCGIFGDDYQGEIREVDEGLGPSIENLSALIASQTSHMQDVPLSRKSQSLASLLIHSRSNGNLWPTAALELCRSSICNPDESTYQQNKEVFREPTHLCTPFNDVLQLLDCDERLSPKSRLLSCGGQDQLSVSPTDSAISTAQHSDCGSSGSDHVSSTKQGVSN